MTKTKKSLKKGAKGKSVEVPLAEFLSRDECLAAGKALREKVPRDQHATWKPAVKRRNPIDVLEESNRDRVPELVPIRYGRMLRSPFTFLRGAAGVMASDLSTTPSTGLRVQACGDCHLLNFGMFATPERNLVFDINDFDETLPAPWEWDVKRLGASFAVAARDNRHSDEEGRDAAVACARAYREHMRDCSKKSPLQVWYERLDMQTLVEKAPDAKARKHRQDMVARARQRIGEILVPKLTTAAGGRHRLVDQPPVLFHVTEKDREERLREAMENYRLSLPDADGTYEDIYAKWFSLGK